MTYGFDANADQPTPAAEVKNDLVRMPALPDKPLEPPLEARPLVESAGKEEGLHQTVTGAVNSRIIVAAGPVTLHEKQPLTVLAVSEAELKVVREAWVSQSSNGDQITVARDAADLVLSGHSALAVIAGPPGTGKRTAAIRALRQISLARPHEGQPLALKEIRPDWEDIATPDIALLPKDSGTAYLLDVASEMSRWTAPGKAAEALLQHAGNLQSVGSCLVVVADDRSWPENSSGALNTVMQRVKFRPYAELVACAHLEYVYRKPSLKALFSKATDGKEAGAASHLLTEDTSPAHAARLAAGLAASDGTTAGIEAAIAAFQKWSTDVIGVFKKTEQNPEDRALLIAGLFLSGSDALTVQEAARKLLDDSAAKSVRDVLTGPDLTTRLEGVHARVTDRTVDFGHKPGYAKAVLLHLWHQRADIHDYLLTWLDSIVADESHSAQLAGISDLLVELAIAESDFRVVEKIKKWIDGSSDESHLQLIARVLGRAAVSRSLGPEVRSKLLTWAQDPSESVLRVVAIVCTGEFADRYPRQALIRLRHILNRPTPGRAVSDATTALQLIAAKEGQLPTVWRMVSRWIDTDKKEDRNGVHRAFLALLDPETDPYVLQVMLEAAHQDSRVEETIVKGWKASLDNTHVDPECRRLIRGWAQARSEGLVRREQTADILNRIIEQHLVSSPISALLFGDSTVRDDKAVIELRRDLLLPAQLARFQLDAPASES
ncbi:MULTISPECIES: hypothetical protein [Streptomyces]|uniref:hypothetical protein n=1 Tax=Streptomyces TaxID=1883 RepID=UPI000938A9BA|nr:MULTISPECIES: hypothetical protein [unclassified Streptomyces]OKJ06427.1 hypothetical protein AMK20_29475 [Streptomyces sp. TSRI0261]QNQ35915.1 hypothetical protein HYC88_21045 [Streptomyces sp. CB00271]